MKDSHPVLFCRREVVLSDFPARDSATNAVMITGSPDSNADFRFAFNDSNFSDRILRIEIVPDACASKFDADGGSSYADWARNRKRRRDEIRKELGLDFYVPHEEQQILICDMPDTEEAAAPFENQDEEVMVTIEELPSNDGMCEEIEQDDESTWGTADVLGTVTVRTMHISSPILAAKSPFFFKLFSNGMRESEQRQVTLHISSSEEAALMELLSFMYSNSLSITTASSLLDVLMLADKFEVASCMRYCSRLLRNMPMTRESALLYLDLPSSVMMAEAVQPLTDAAKEFLAACYKDISKFQEEIFNLPLAGFEAVMTSDDLQVASEDAVYDIVLKWARIHYPRPDERREVIGSRLGRLIRFPFMTCRKLKKVMACPDLEREVATKVVLEALFYKAEAPYRQRTRAAEDAAVGLSRRFVERAYKYRPVKVVEFEQPRQQCMVYFDLKREECANLFPSGRVYSQAFHLGGQGFFLSAHCNMDQMSSFHCFGLFLGMQEKGSVTFAVDYEFSVRLKSTEEFERKYKGNYVFTGGKAVGYRNLFNMPWTAFIADESTYFIKGNLHLKAELTIKQHPPQH